MTERARRRPAEWPAILTTQEACAFLDVRESTLRELREKDGLPCAWLGSQSPRYVRDDLIAWLRERSRAECVRNGAPRRTASDDAGLRRVR